MLTDEIVGSNPDMMLMIRQYWKSITECGFETLSLVEQYNLAVSFDRF